MNKPLSSLLAILCGIMAVCGITPNAHAANDAAKLLEQSAAKIKTAKSVDVAYTLKSGNTDVKGTLLLSGNKFYAVNNAMTVGMTALLSGLTLRQHARSISSNLPMKSWQLPILSQ